MIRINEMYVDGEAFSKIADGSRSVMLFLYDEKRRLISRAKDSFRFINKQDNKGKIYVRIKDLHIYPSFAELFESGLLEKCGFENATVADAVNLMRKYYSAEDEKKYGVIGIEFVKE